MLQFTTDPLYDNPKRVVDGPCYAFVVHGIGPAVGGFGEKLDEAEATTSSNIRIEGNTINNIQCWNKEIPAIVNSNDKAQNDARGAIFQLYDTFSGEGIAIDDEGKYVSNPVADMQLCEWILGFCLVLPDSRASTN